MVNDAVAEGATVALGGSPLTDIGPHFYAPTVLTNVQPSMRVAAEEVCCVLLSSAACCSVPTQWNCQITFLSRLFQTSDLWSSRRSNSL
jgi:hypothetical protein